MCSQGDGLRGIFLPSSFIVPKGTFPSKVPSFPGVTILPSSPFLSLSLSFWQVHQSTHIWNCSPARRGRQPSLEGPVPLLSGDQVNLQDFLSQDIPCPAGEGGSPVSGTSTRLSCKMTYPPSLGGPVPPLLPFQDWHHQGCLA